MEGFPKRVVWAQAGCVGAIGVMAWLVAVVATPQAPWLQPLPGESVVLGLGPVALGDVLTAIVVAALVGAASSLAAWARRPIWIPAVIAWVVAPPIAARVSGAEFAMPAPLGHWHEILFAGRTLGIDALLGWTWTAAALEMLVITAPAVWLTVRRRPAVRHAAMATAAIAVASLVDIWLGEGLMAGPLGLVAGSAGVGLAGWLVAATLVVWASLTAGPGGAVAALGLMAGIRSRTKVASRQVGEAS